MWNVKILSTIDGFFQMSLLSIALDVEGRQFIFEATFLLNLTG